MAPAKDKWVRRFIIPETARHKRGFTIYKVTSVVFLKSSHEEISKVSVWKRYNDFKKLHSELSTLHSRSQIKESFPTFPKSKFFGRFEAEVIEERREYALKFLEFIGRHSYLYSSDIFIKFFETSHGDYANDCSQSLSSDTSEDDRHAYGNSVSMDNTVSQNVYQRVPKKVQGSITNSSPALSNSNRRDNAELESQRLNESKGSKKESKSCMSVIDETRVADTNCADSSTSAKENSSEKIAPTLDDNQSVLNCNNNCDKNTRSSETNDVQAEDVETSGSTTKTNSVEDSQSPVTIHDGSDLPQTWPDSSQYILIAAAHMSAAFRHEAMAEYEEAFTQYKMGISNLLTGVQTDTDTTRAEVIKEKISKYLERAEKLYNRHLNCNVSLLNKPVSELQYYKVLKIMRSVMLVRDVRQNCLRIVKAIEKSAGNKESISNYILRGQVPYMVRLHACVETETTVFLILQHLSRGKLWDLITLHYKTSNNTCYDNTNTEDTLRKVFDSNDIILRENELKRAVEYAKTSIINNEFISTSPKVQTLDYSLAVDAKDEIYSSDVPTTQLLEKAQILLQSVSATLKESNFIASRLHESNQLINHKDDTMLLNMKNTKHQPEEWNIILTNVNEDQNVNRTESEQKGNSPETKNVPEISVINTHSSPKNVGKNTKSQYITDTSSINSSCKDLSESESTDYLTNGAKTVYNHFSAEDRCNKNTEIVTEAYNMNDQLNTYTKMDTNNYIRSEDQMQYINSVLLADANKNSNIDVEEELWTIPENVIRLWAAEILLALEALHQQEVIVHDLRPDNILLDDSGHIQLTYIVPQRDTDFSKHKHPYASPELCTFLPTIPITPATDIWSFGVILYELIVGNKFLARHPGLFHSHSVINIPSKLSENAKSLLINILRYQPNERMTIPEIKQHPFFEEIEWSSLLNPT